MQISLCATGEAFLSSIDHILQRIARGTKYQAPGVEVEDLLQESRLAATRAIKRGHTAIEYIARSVQNALWDVKRRAMTPSARILTCTSLLENQEEEHIDVAERATNQSYYREMVAECMAIVDDPTDRYILNSIGQGCTDQEIADLLGMSRQLVNEKKNRLLTELRAHLTKKGYSP